jgi:hypothetical protein
LDCKRTKDPKKYAARRIVSERLRDFFALLKDQLAHGAETLWKRVEGRLDGAENAADESRKSKS